MKNTFKVFGIIALLVVITFSMAACSDDSGSDTAKKITITGLPSNSSGGWGIWVFSDLNDIVGHVPRLTAVGYTTFSGASTVTFDLFVPENDTTKPTSEKWTGSGSYYVYLIAANSSGGFSTLNAYIYMSDSSTPTKVTIDKGTTTLPANQLVQYNVYR